MSAIAEVRAREILDSRGNPTVEVDVVLEGGSMGRAAVPSGASTGAHEAVEKRDGDKKRYGGKGVLKAVDAVNGEIFDPLSGVDAEDQRRIDRAADRARRHAEQVPARRQRHPRRLARRGQGGGEESRPAALQLCRRHPGLAPAGADDEHHQRRRPRRQSDRHPGIHDPAGQGADRFAEALRMGSEIFHALRGQLKAAGHNTNVGDEGGFAPNLASAEEALGFIVKAGEEAGYKPGEDFMLALDAASTEFFKSGKYVLAGEGKSLDPAGMVDYFAGLVAKYPIVSIEDGMAEDDMDGWKLLTDKLGRKIQLVGDDLFVTNPERLADGIKDGLANSILVKVNQIGTLTRDARRRRSWRSAPATAR